MRSVRVVRGAQVAWALMKKEVVELSGSLRTLMMVAGVNAFFVYASIDTDVTRVGGLEAKYLMLLLAGLSASQLLVESVLSEKRQRTLEILLAARWRHVVVLSKVAVSLALSIILGGALCAFWWVSGRAASLELLGVVNVYVLLWSAGCAAIMVTLLNPDERIGPVMSLGLMLFVGAVLWAIGRLRMDFGGWAATVVLGALGVALHFVAVGLLARTRIFLRG